MAPTPSTRISFFKAVYFCTLAVFRPQRFTDEEALHSERLRATPPAESRPGVYNLRQAFLRALQLVLASGGVGVALAKVLCWAYGRAGSSTIAGFQIASALLLLWATLAVLGWDIQTFKGGTLSEKVNQWIYRFLYCFGTVTLVISLAWTPV